MLYMYYHRISNNHWLPQPLLLTTIATQPIATSAIATQPYCYHCHFSHCYSTILLPLPLQPLLLNHCYSTILLPLPLQPLLLNHIATIATSAIATQPLLPQPLPLQPFFFRTHPGWNQRPYRTTPTVSYRTNHMCHEGLGRLLTFKTHPYTCSLVN